MLNVGGGEILVILVMALIFLGPKRLPETGRQIGRAIAEFRRVTSGVQQELRDVLDMEGVREGLETFRGVVDVRKTLVNEFTSATAGLSVNTTGRASGSTAASHGSSAVPPPDGVLRGDRSNTGFAGESGADNGANIPSPTATRFHDVLVDAPATAPKGSVPTGVDVLAAATESD